VLELEVGEVGAAVSNVSDVFRNVTSINDQCSSHFYCLHLYTVTVTSDGRMSFPKVAHPAKEPLTSVLVVTSTGERRVSTVNSAHANG
jgi:hypothetical protein